MTTEKFSGLAIEINDNINDAERWVLGPEANDPSVDFDATMTQYIEAVRAALHEAYPGVAVDYLLTNGGGRTQIIGQGGDLAYAELCDALDDGQINDIIATVCPDGDPLPFIVTKTADH